MAKKFRTIQSPIYETTCLFANSIESDYLWQCKALTKHGLNKVVKQMIEELQEFEKELELDEHI